MINRKMLLLTWILLLALLNGCTDKSSSQISSAEEQDIESEASPVEERLVVVDVSAINAALRDGDISELDANLYHTYGLMGMAENVPAEYHADLENLGQSANGLWHNAPTAVLAEFESLDAEAQDRILNFFAENGSALNGAESQHVARPNLICVSEAGGHIQLCTTPPANEDPMLFAILMNLYWYPTLAAEADYLWDLFSTFYGFQPSEVVSVHFTDIEAVSDSDGSWFVFGLVPELDGEIPTADWADCAIYIDTVLYNPITDQYSSSSQSMTIPLPDTEDLDELTVQGIMNPEDLRATLAHELFHCFQVFSQGIGPVALPSANNWLWEGTAMWSEHLAYGSENTEWGQMNYWVSDPHSAFLSRAHDAVFPFMHTYLSSGNTSAISQLLDAVTPFNDAAAVLENDFIPAIGGGEAWHQISVTGWNVDPPVDPLSESGAQVYSPPYFDVVDIHENETGQIDYALTPFSHYNYKIHLVEDEEEINRLYLDLGNIFTQPNLYIEALVQRSDGEWEDPISLTGVDEAQFCIENIGPCAEQPTPVFQYDIEEGIESVTLIITNISSEELNISIPIDTANPHLHGNWRRTAADIHAGGNFAPFQILETGLGFDETIYESTETTGSPSLVGNTSGWDCNFAGASTVSFRPSYDSYNGPNAIGLVYDLAPLALITPWVNDCVYTSGPENFPIGVSNLHIPVAASPSFSYQFELSNEGNTLTVTISVGPALRIYTYQRIN